VVDSIQLWKPAWVGVLSAGCWLQYYRCCKRVIGLVQGSELAGELTAHLDVFKNATNIRADPDKPLQHIRLLTLKVCHWLCIIVLLLLGLVTIKIILIVKPRTMDVQKNWNNYKKKNIMRTRTVSKTGDDILTPVLHSTLYLECRALSGR